MSNFLDLMSQLNIGAVYWIDDENADRSELSLEKLSKGFLAALLRADEAQAKDAMTIFENPDFKTRVRGILAALKNQGEDEASKIERISPILDELLSELDDAKISVVNALRKLPGPLGDTERDALRTLFNEKSDTPWKWHTLSFTKWAAEGSEIIRNHNEDRPILLIVDLQNTNEETATNGESVLSDVASSQINRKACHLIVLTSECKEKDEFKKGRSLTDEFFKATPQRIPVFALSKNRFSNDVDKLPAHMAAAFATALQRANLSLVHLEFAGLMREHFRESIDRAFVALESITIEELAFGVTRTSQDEGVSETETLVRLMNIAQREEFQLAIAGNENLRQTILRLRGANLPINKSDLDSDKELVKLRCAELYDKSEVVNGLFSPLAPGDLFVIEVSSNEPEKPPLKKLYVLVANACDLMLRKDGKRRLDTGMLLPIGEPDNDKERQFRFDLRHLDFLGIGGNSTKQIELRDYRSIPLKLLDLCWSNAQGKVEWKNTLPGDIADYLRDSQRARMIELNSLYPNFTDSDLISMAHPLGISIEKAVSEKELTEVKFSISRVGRLSPTHATQLVSRFTGVFGRPSEAHDFSKTP